MLSSKKILRGAGRCFNYFFMILILMTANASTVFAQSADGLRAIFGDSPYFDVTTDNCTGVTTLTDGSKVISPTELDITWGRGVWGSGSNIYQSGLEGPYTLEAWAISVLRNIALKSGLPESTILTQQKVLALVVFAHTEGGGVSGHNGTYNPVNTKLNHEDLHGENQGNAATDSNSNGFPTFDQGVEANTRAMFVGVQKRVGTALLNPDTTPEQFLEAVTGDFYYDATLGRIVNGWEEQYPGDKVWATGSATGYVYNPATGAAGNHDAHLRSKMNALSYVRNNYAAVAGKLLDMPDRVPDTRTPIPPLVYTADGLTGEELPGCTNDNGASASSPGANGWDLPGEGPNPLKYYYSQLLEGNIKYKSYTDYYGPYPGYGGTCGPTSAAVVVSNLTGVKVEQPIMVQWFMDNGYQWKTGSNSNLFGNPEYIAKFEAKWGVTSRRIGNNATAIADAIKGGELVIISLKSPSPQVSGGDNPDTADVETGAHITVIRAVTDDNKFLFADTTDSYGKNRRNPILVNGSSRTPLSFEELGPLSTGIYAFKKSATPAQPEAVRQ